MYVKPTDAQYNSGCWVQFNLKQKLLPSSAANISENLTQWKFIWLYIFWSLIHENLVENFAIFDVIHIFCIKIFVSRPAIRWIVDLKKVRKMDNFVFVNLN